MINTELHNGDCLEYMKKIPTSSIDLIITDPPYNLGKFMEERDTNLVKMRDNFFGAVLGPSIFQNGSVSYQYRQRTPNKRCCQAMILNLFGNRIASC